MSGTRNGENYHARNGKAHAGKHHLAAGHIGSDGKFAKAKSLNEISTEKPTLIQGDYNIGKKGNLLTLPAYTAFLLTEI